MLSDVNGEYPAMESAEIRTAEGNRYTVFSLWDTYRNLHQLMTLVYPERQLEMVRSMIGMYRSGAGCRSGSFTAARPSPWRATRPSR